MDGVLESGAGRRAKRILLTGVAAAAAVSALIVVGVPLAIAHLTKADKAFWTVSGPPCPKVGPAQIARMVRPLAQVSNFGEGRFARVSGSVLCDNVRNGLGLVRNTVCQFNRPRALGVWSKGGVAYFDLAGGEPATVTASDHQPPRCVMASKYNGE